MRELLFSVTKKDLEISYFSGTGAGGQHRNKHQNCVRMKHPASGATATGQTARSRAANLKAAFKSLVASDKFKTWLQLEISSRLYDEISIEEKVERMMSPENLLIEEIEL